MTEAGNTDAALTDAALSARIRAIIAKATLVPESALQDGVEPQALGIDSLGLVESIFALEEAFAIKVPFNANQPDQPGLDVTTIGALVRDIMALIRARQG